MMDKAAALLTLFGLASAGAAHEASERHPLYEPSVPMERRLPPGELKTGAVRDFVRLPHGLPPQESMLQETLRLEGWRGERVSGQVAAWSSGAQMQLSVSCDGLRHAGGACLPVEAVMVRYTKVAGALQPDVISHDTSCDMPSGGVRPIWVGVDIPADAAPGVYRGAVRIWSETSEARHVPVELTVEPEVLPPPAQWRARLDLWQHPQAVARWHGVQAWSPEHLALLKPLMKRLADAGQKAITCSLLDEAWNGQTYDFFPGMVRWVLGRDGRMRYDYSAFDTWVRFMMEEAGVTGWISCYTMIPWSMKIRYFDEGAGVFKNLDLRPQDPSFERIWGSFLTDFRAHVKGKGWLDKTCIALDERPDAMLRAARDVISRYAPEFRIVSAVNAPSSAASEVDDLSPILTHADSITPEMLAQRKAQGKTTTFYVCMHPLKPNTFTASPLAEARWLGLFAAANKLDGFLRWAYNSWNRNPFETTDFNSAGNWPSGDCFLVYPGNLSSLRFESLRDGLEDFEKVGLLRDRAARMGTPKAREAIRQLDEGLARLFTVSRSQGTEHEADVCHARELIRRTAEALR